jgi:hemolysin activation/secretion protein
MRIDRQLLESGERGPWMECVRHVRLAGLALLLFASPPVSAQTAPLEPMAPTREEVQRTPATTEPARGPRLKVSGGVERTPCPLAEERFKDVTITLSDVVFDNLRALPKEALRSSYEAFLGRPAPIAIVCEIRDAAAAILNDAGYLAAVRVPPQRIDAGVVRFEVVMARLVALRVRGDAGRAESRIANYLTPLKEKDAFSARDAERYLLLAGDIPGFDVRLTLKPAETGTPGEVIGEVTVIRTPLDVDFNVQNFGSRQVGRVGGLLRAQLYGLTGMGDRTTIGLFSSSDFKEQQVLQLGHDVRVGREGMSLSGRFTYAWTSPDIPGIEVDARTMVATGEVGYPFLRSQTANVRGAIGFDYIDQEVELGAPGAGTAPFSTDHLRVAYLRIDADATDRQSVLGLPGYSMSEPLWRIGGSLELRQGLDILDASERCGAGACVLSRPFADPTAALIRFAGAAEYRPMPKLTFVFAPRAQYSSKALLSFEEFSAGNYTVGRGFDPGALTGDSGVGFQLEARMGSAVPRTLTDIAFEPFVFVDAAWVWNRDSDYTGPDPQHLTSVGGGVRLAYGDRARLDATLAFPVDRTKLAPGKDPTRLLLSLTTKLWPWTRM